MFSNCNDILYTQIIPHSPESLCTGFLGILLLLAAMLLGYYICTKIKNRRHKDVKFVYVNTYQNSLAWIKVRKKPVEVEAVQMTYDFKVNTLEGVMSGSAGDYLIRGVEGELYSCKEAIFKKTYSEAD